VDADFDVAEKQVREALAAEGFGILTEIDVAATLKEKLGVDWTPYRILGACNPPLAHRALQVEEDVGLLLPCNVILYRREDRTVVAALDPLRMMDLAGNPDLEPVAVEARARLERALGRLKG
jgi:uncharacterized protein (DUF302 family)